MLLSIHQLFFEKEIDSFCHRPLLTRVGEVFAWQCMKVGFDIGDGVKARKLARLLLYALEYFSARERMMFWDRIHGPSRTNLLPAPIAHFCQAGLGHSVHHEERVFSVWRCGRNSRNSFNVACGRTSLIELWEIDCKSLV